MRGFLDGTTPDSGFGYLPPAEPGFSVNMGDGSETFRRISVYNMNFSARDIQVGVLPEPLRFTAINLEAGGVRLTWNPRANKTYNLDSFPAIGASPNNLGSALTGPDYLDPQPLNSNPARFYRLREQ